MSEEFKCEECGREFDSSRGLSSHQRQAHPEEENEGGTDADKDGTQTITLETRHVIVSVFVLGLAIGLASGLGLSSINPSMSDGSTGQPADSVSTPEEAFKSFADDIGADKSAFGSCYSSSTGEEWKGDKSEIESIEGRLGTPTFFIGNSQIGYEKVTGAQPLSDSSKPNMLDDLEEQLSEAESGGEVEGNETGLEGVELQGEPSLGSENADVKVIQYSDYGCPFCSEWAGHDASPRIGIDRFNWFGKLKDNYINQGRVEFIYKDYPVKGLHPNAPKAHQAANCILEQDKDLYWKFHDKLYEERGKWVS